MYQFVPFHTHSNFAWLFVAYTYERSLSRATPLVRNNDSATPDVSVIRGIVSVRNFLKAPSVYFTILPDILQL